jgi:CheY-like chemotaxis protein
VLAAANATTALEIIDCGHELGLLFTDVVMPGGMNGRQLARRGPSFPPCQASASGLALGLFEKLQPIASRDFRTWACC